MARVGAGPFRGRLQVELPGSGVSAGAEGAPPADDADQRVPGDGGPDRGRDRTIAGRVLRMTSPVRRTAGLPLPRRRARAGARRFDGYAIPAPDRSPAVAFHVALDELTLSTMKLVRREPPHEFWDTARRETADAVELFERQRLDDGSARVPR